MKNLIIIFFLFCTFQNYGQDNEVINSSWKLSAIGTRAAQNYQHHAGLTFSQFQKDAHDPKRVDFDMSNYDRKYMDSNFMEDFGLFVRLSKVKKNKVTKDLEFELDYTGFSELYTEYSHKQDRFKFMGWCLMQSRINLAVKYLTNYHSDFTGIRIGPSIGLGTSFNDNLLIITPDPDTPAIIVDAKSNIYLTSHLHVQIYFVLLNKLEFGIGGKAGIGTQGRQPNAIGSYGLDANVAYNF